MVNNKLEKVTQLLKEDKIKEASELFIQIQPENTTDYWMTKGIIEQKFQRWGSSLNAFNKVLRLEPDNRESKNSIQLIKNILNFWNPEMFNP